MSFKKSAISFAAGAIFTASLAVNIGFAVAQSNGQNSVSAPVSAGEQSNVLVNAAAALSSTNGVIGGQGNGANNQGAGASNAVNSNVSNTTTTTASRDYNNYTGATVQQAQPEKTTQIVKSTVPVNAAPLTTSGLDTCLGSVSGGVSVPGVGISAAKTVIDDNCVMLKNSKRLQEVGLKDAAVALMMHMDPRIAKAIQVANPEIHDALMNPAKIKARAQSQGVEFNEFETDRKPVAGTVGNGD